MDARLYSARNCDSVAPLGWVEVGGRTKNAKLERTDSMVLTTADTSPFVAAPRLMVAIAVNSIGKAT
jgi:hypothetical protein